MIKRGDMHRIQVIDIAKSVIRSHVAREKKNLLKKDNPPTHGFG